MPHFKASVQYGDWDGTASADDIDPANVSVRRYLEEKGLVKPHEFLIAAQLFVGETHRNDKLPEPYIRAFVLEGVDTYEEAKQRLKEFESPGEPVPVREIEIEMSLQEFVGMFKRFEVMLTWEDLPLTDREYRVIEK